jgi:uncharacterized protein YjbI with pentapeptide repeats
MIDGNALYEKLGRGKFIKWLKDNQEPGLVLRDAQIGGFEYAGQIKMRGLDLRAADLARSCFSYVNMRNSDLSGGMFLDTDLKGACLQGSTIANADFSSADLRDADLRRCKITNTVFTHAQLHNARFDGSTLDRVDFRNTSLRRYMLKDCTENGCRFSG